MKDCPLQKEDLLNWLKSHDWFVFYDGLTGRAYVRDVVVHQDGTVTDRLRTFTSFPELLAWAGY